MIWKLIGNVRFFIDKCKKDNINAFAAQSTFFIILSAIPLLMVFSSLLKYTPVTQGVLMEVVNRMAPSYIAPFCISIIQEVYSKSFGIISAAAIIAIWSAAKGVQYLSLGLNAVYNIKETRNWFVLKFWAIIYTIIFVLAIVIMLVLMVFGNSLRDVVVKYVPILVQIADLIIQLRGLVTLCLLIVFFTVIFKALPNRKATFRSQLPGAVLSAVAWHMFSFGLSIYVSYFNGFSMYGSLTTVVLIMLWLYFCIYIMMICAEINDVYQENIVSRIEKRRRKKNWKKRG